MEYWHGFLKNGAISEKEFAKNKKGLL